jgi:acetyl-CoA acetyltransferase
MVAAEISARMDEVKASIVSANEAARADLTTMAARLSSITPAAEEPTGYATVYHPSTTQLQSAAAVTLGISEERPNVDIQLQLVPMAKVTGAVMGPDGVPMAGSSIQLVDISSPVPGHR